MKLLIVSEHKLLLDLLTEHLSKCYDEIYVITDASLAELKCERLAPNLVLMDICSKAGPTGLYAAEKIKKRHHNIKVVLMTGYEDMSFIKRAKEMHVESFIYKRSGLDELMDCLERTLNGECCYPQLEGDVTFGITHEHLTQRELEILRLFCQSKSRKEMADALKVSTSTINFHINNMLVKTGYKKLRSLAMEAANKGYIRIEDEDND